MPSGPRSEVVIADEPGIYHCYTRVVQRARLCGYDPVTSRDYDYRKEWVRTGLRRLAKYMSLEVLDFAVLDNHLHVIVRTRPDVAEEMSEREVALRWGYLCRTAGLSEEERQLGERPPRPTESQIEAMMGDAEQLGKLRERLSSLSWLMRLLCQPIARNANKEMGTSGHFFADRFKCKRIEDEAGLLACAMYVNMNPIRAGMVSTPEAAEFTSGFARIHGLLARQARGVDVLGELRPDPKDPDAWLAPVFLSPEATAYQSVDDHKCPVNMSFQLDADEEDATDDAADATDDVTDVATAEQLVTTDDPGVPSERVPDEHAGAAVGLSWRGRRLVPEVFSGRLTNKGYLPITADEFLSLWKWTSRQLADDAEKTVPSDLARMMARLGVESEEWLETVQAVDSCFPTSIGSVASLQQRAEQRGRHWLRGTRRAAVAFHETAST